MVEPYLRKGTYWSNQKIKRINQQIKETKSDEVRRIEL